MPRVTYKVRDQDKDHQQFSFPAAVANAGNFAARQAEFNAFTAALADMIVGTIVNTDYSMLGAEIDLTPTTQLAQTNVQWIAVWSDTVLGGEMNTRIGTADLLLLPLGSTILAAGTEFTAFKAAFDALVVSPAGNPATLLRLEYRE